MAKGRKEEPPAGAPMWLATYGDMMTLLLCFFVLMYSMSVIDAQKLLDVSKHLNPGNQPTIIDFSGNLGITGILGNGIIEFPLPTEATEVVEEADEDSREMLEAYIESKQNELTEAYGYASPYETYIDDMRGIPQLMIQALDDQMLEIKIGGDCLFSPGSAVLLPEFDITELASLVMELYVQGDVIVVEGHTDNVPMNSSRSRFGNNWELSGGRAAAVVEALMRATGLPGECFVVRACSEYEPIADNSTLEGRELNRRVMIYMQQPLKFGN